MIKRTDPKASSGLNRYNLWNNIAGPGSLFHCSGSSKPGLAASDRSALNTFLNIRGPRNCQQRVMWTYSILSVQKLISDAEVLRSVLKEQIENAASVLKPLKMLMVAGMLDCGSGKLFRLTLIVSPVMLLI